MFKQSHLKLIKNTTTVYVLFKMNLLKIQIKKIQKKKFKIQKKKNGLNLIKDVMREKL